MIGYNFLNLSPVEFEELTRDLLQLHLNCFFESFKEGKDSGIDLRYSSNSNNTNIVQCKRYKDYESLEPVLKKEVAKVRKLNPNKYTLVTSAGLSPLNKKNIKKIFHPFIKSEDDILGNGELNNLLGQYPDIEKKHYKLWLSSTAILQKIVNNNVINRSDFLKENILENVKLFVQNEAFNKSIKILNNHNFVIISGNPGVGKTTLAKIIAYELMVKDYEVVEISPDIEDANKFIEQDKKQLFYYDDFLGRNFIGSKLNKNEDKRLVSFIERIQKSKDKKLIMTTREYILNQAKQQFDLLNRPEFDVGRYVIDLTTYNKLIRAKIFYNHLFFSKIPTGNIQYLLDNRRYNNIIQHENYNPRVIEMMTVKYKNSQFTAEEYYDNFLKSLDNPEEIWKHAFENQISEVSRGILFVLLISSDSVTENNLIKSLKRLLKNEYLGNPNISFNRINFTKALRELENTFIKITNNNAGITKISFENPSVRDFMINYIKKDNNGNNEISRNLILCITFLDQLFSIFTIDRPRYISKGTQKILLNETLEEMLIDLILDKFDDWSTSHLFESIMYIHNNNSFKSEKINRLLSDKLKFVDLEDLNGWEDKEDYVDILLSLDAKGIDEELLIKQIIDDLYSFPDIKALVSLKETYPAVFEKIKNSDTDNFIRQLQSAIRNELSEVSIDNQTVEDIAHDIRTFEKSFDCNLSSAVDDLYERLDEERYNRARNEMLSEYSKREGQTDDENYLIENMFNTLKTE